MTASATGPIGVFDSGLGGLTVVREMLRTLPHEPIVYVGDTAHVPYGGRDLSQISDFAHEISRFLLEEMGCRALVMACNISSAVAFNDVARSLAPLPVLGVIEPGARAAIEVSQGRPVAVLTTEGTAKSGAYARALDALAPGVPVSTVACPLFVPLVEAGLTETPDAAAAARGYLAQTGQAPVVILGCTHYPFLLPVLQREAGPGVMFVDPAGETVRELSHLLGDTPPAPAPSHQFFATGDPADFARGAQAFLGEVAAQPGRLRWHRDSASGLRLERG